MTTNPPEAPAEPAPGPDGPRVTREEVKQLGRIRRTVGPDRKIAGVAGGLARHLDIDPVILRVGFVVLVFFGGAGLIAYGAAWLLLPEEGSLRRPLGLDDRNRGIALIGAGILAGVIMLSGTLGNHFFPWPVAIVGVIAFIVLGLVDRDRPRPTAPPIPHHPDPVTGELVPATPGTFVTPQPPAYQPTQPAYQPTYQAPYQAPYRAPVPRNPRRRGPILFWFTMALAALGIGALAVVDLAGVSVAPAAYPAVVVGACGLMLLVGSFYGRPGGLILIGLLASVALLGASVVQHVDGRDVLRTPTTAAEVPTHIDNDAGEVVLDLTDVTDLAALDGRRLSIHNDFGRVEVVVPAGLGVAVRADVKGPGDIQLFGDEHGGIGISDTAHHSAGAGAPSIALNLSVRAGEIDVHEEAAP